MIYNVLSWHGKWHNIQKYVKCISFGCLPARPGVNECREHESTFFIPFSWEHIGKENVQVVYGKKSYYHFKDWGC